LGDLRRITITWTFDSGLVYRQVQMMSKHRDPKMVSRYFIESLFGVAA